MLERPLRLLVVDDDGEIRAQVSEFFRVFSHARAAEGFKVLEEQQFARYASRLDEERVDLVVLDIQKDAAPTDPTAGLQSHNAAVKRHLVPTVFFTAHAEKADAYRSTFVDVVSKDQGVEALGEAVSRLLDTGLITLRLFLEGRQRELLADAMSQQRPGATSTERAATSAALAAALANELSDPAFRALLGLDPNRLHPSECWSVARVPHLLTGDVLKKDGMYITVLSPCCDLVCDAKRRPKVKEVLVARCVQAKDHVICKDVGPATEKAALSTKALEEGEQQLAKATSEKAEPDKLRKLERQVESLRNVWRKAERAKEVARAEVSSVVRNTQLATHFLAGIEAMVPDLVVEFRELEFVPLEASGAAAGWTRVASLASPFRELLNSRFAQFVGRVGVPELDQAAIFQRLGLESD